MFRYHSYMYIPSQCSGCKGKVNLELLAESETTVSSCIHVLQLLLCMHTHTHRART